MSVIGEPSVARLEWIVEVMFVIGNNLSVVRSEWIVEVMFIIGNDLSVVRWTVEIMLIIRNDLCSIGTDRRGYVRN